MTSTRDSYSDLGPAEDAAFLEDLLAVHEVDVPNLAFTLPQRAIRSPGFFGRHWRPVLVAAAVAGLALVLGASVLPGNDATGVSAEEILQRASGATAASASDSRPYHLRAQTTVSAEKIGSSPATLPSETWYAGETQYRVENRGPDGLSDGHARNGDDFWVFIIAPSGQLRVAHGPAGDLGLGFNGVALPGTNSLSEMLAQYSKPCMKARLEGETQALNRDAYVIRVDFEPNSCGKDLKEAARTTRKDSTRITIDKELFLPLVSERIDETGNVSYRYEVTQLDLDPVFDPFVFAYQPPAGAVVREVASMAEAKMALADFESTEKPGSGGGCEAVLPPVNEKEPDPNAVECLLKKP